MMRLGTYVIGGILLIVAALYVFGASNFGVTFNPRDVGPGYFPVGVGALLIVLVLIVLGQETFGRGSVSWVDLSSFIPLVLPLVALAILYILGIQYVGYFSSTAIFLIISLIFLYRIELKLALIVSLIFCTFVFVVFVLLLRTSFPTGYLF